MGLLYHKNHVMAARQTPGAPPTGMGIFGDDTLTTNPTEATAAPTLALDTDVQSGGGFTSAPPLVSGHTAVITVTPVVSSTPSPTSNSPDASSSMEASSGSAQPISMSTVIGSCVGAFIGAVALICLSVWFYRRYQRSLKATYGSRSRGPRNNRADLQRRQSHREQWGKLEDSNPEDKWEGHAKTEESVAPMEKLTMFKKAASIRTAYTHTDEEPVQFEMSHPFAQQYYNRSPPNADDSNAQNDMSMPSSKPFMAHNADGHTLSWGDAAQGSFLSVRTQSDHLSGSMSPSLSMAIPTPPATSSPLHRWESAEIINMEGQSAEIVNPFGDDRAGGHKRQKSSGNPFFGAHEDMPKRRSRSNSLNSKASRASRARSATDSVTSSVYVPMPKVDKGKGRAIDPFDDELSPAPTPTPTPSFTTAVSIPVTTTNNVAPTSPLTPPQPAFATHVTSLSGSSVSSNDRALASLLAALEGDATEEDIQTRLRIASMQPSINSSYSEGSEADVTKEFPLPPSTPGHSTTTLESYVTAESDRTVKTR